VEEKGKNSVNNEDMTPYALKTTTTLGLFAGSACAKCAPPAVTAAAAPNAIVLIKSRLFVFIYHSSS